MHERYAIISFYNTGRTHYDMKETVRIQNGAVQYYSHEKQDWLLRKIRRMVKYFAMRTRRIIRQFRKIFDQEKSA